MKTDPSKKKIVTLITYFDLIRTRFISRFFSDPLLKGAVIIGSGTVISQILGIIFVPILTRIYSPSDYGTLSVFISLLSILTVGATLQYELTIPIAENNDDALYLVILSFLIVLIITIILFLSLLFFGNLLAEIFHIEFILPYNWLFCLGFFGISGYQILTYWAIREKNFVQITHTKITQSISGSVSKIILGILSYGSFGLIFGEIIGRMLGIGTLGRTILPKILRMIHNFDFRKMRSLAFKYNKFPTYSFPASFINEISLQIPILFLTSIFGLEIVGLYTLSFSMLVLPVLLVSHSIAQAYLAEVSDLFRNKSDKMLDLYQKTTKKLFFFGAPLIFIGAIISPIVYPIIFGSAWKDADLFSLPLSIMVIAAIVVSSTDSLALIGYNHWSLIWNICRTIIVIFGFFLAFQFNLSPVTTILLYSLLMTIMFAINYILNIKAAKLIMQKLQKND
jgi:O-antigen/teichoic acid export membrane protein